MPWIFEACIKPRRRWRKAQWSVNRLRNRALFIILRYNKPPVWPRRRLRNCHRRHWPLPRRRSPDVPVRPVRQRPVSVPRYSELWESRINRSSNSDLFEYCQLPLIRIVKFYLFNIFLCICTRHAFLWIFSVNSHLANLFEKMF